MVSEGRRELRCELDQVNQVRMMDIEEEETTCQTEAVSHAKTTMANCLLSRCVYAKGMVEGRGLLEVC